MTTSLMADDLDMGHFDVPDPCTVDILFELPETDRRYEVLDGKLAMSPAPTPAHSAALAQLTRLFLRLLPGDLWLLQDTAVRLPSGDGPIPDLLITSAPDLTRHKKGLPASLVHTVIEVVSPSNPLTDRDTKTRLYAEGGIPCYWRVEQRPWPEHHGPVPAIVVRLRDKAGDWHQTMSVAGRTSDLPVVIDADGTTVMVTIDPAMLSGKR